MTLNIHAPHLNFTNLCHRYSTAGLLNVHHCSPPTPTIPFKQLALNSLFTVGMYRGTPAYRTLYRRLVYLFIPKQREYKARCSLILSTQY